MLVLDLFGDVDPQASVFSSRAGLAALGELAGDPSLMAGLKQQMRQRWQTSPSKEPEIRLSTAWQDGPTTIFIIAVAGLVAEDDRFYCPDQTWMIGDSTEEIAVECMAHKAGTPVGRVFFESMTINGSSERLVQITLDGVPSNTVQVHEGEVAQETAIFQAVLQQITDRPLIVRGETAPGFDATAEQLTAAIAPAILQDYLAANQIPFSLRFLFQNSSVYFVQPGEVIAHDYLTTSEPQQACEQFRSDYPGLGGGRHIEPHWLQRRWHSGISAYTSRMWPCRPPRCLFYAGLQ